MHYHVVWLILIVPCCLPASGNNLIYIDPGTLRRGTSISTAITSTNQDAAITMATTASQLARAFGIVVRLLTDLLNMLQNYHTLAPNLPCVLNITEQQEQELQVKIMTVNCVYSEKKVCKQHPENVQDCNSLSFIR